MELSDMPHWGEKRVFSKFEAYLDFMDKKNKGHPISIRQLADKWEWSKSNVSRFVSELNNYNIEKLGTANGTANGTAETVIEDSSNVMVGTENGTANGTAEILQEKISYNGLMSYFNTTFNGKLPLIQSMTESRKKAVKARVGEYGKESVRTVFNNILKSQFLIGNNDKNWRADFDWIFKAKNYTKILEGNYNGERADTKAARRESVSRLKDLAGKILQGTKTDDDK